MSYPSIISQPGSASRNVKPITDALAPLLSEGAGRGGHERRVLELASFPYEHISAFAERWEDVEWRGSCRDAGEVGTVRKQVYENGSPAANLREPRILDVSVNDHWDSLESDVDELKTSLPAFEGVVMLNLVHCCPEGVPEHIFRHLSPKSPGGRKLLDPKNGWIAAYGAYKNDDGTYKSEGDREFERTHIQVDDSSLGLRTVRSITDMAERWGFVEERREEMPKGNMFVVWRVKP